MSGHGSSLNERISHRPSVWQMRLVRAENGASGASVSKIWLNKLKLLPPRLVDSFFAWNAATASATQVLCSPRSSSGQVRTVSLRQLRQRGQGTNIWMRGAALLQKEVMETVIPRFQPFPIWKKLNPMLLNPTLSSRAALDTWWGICRVGLVEMDKSMVNAGK